MTKELTYIYKNKTPTRYSQLHLQQREKAHV